MENKQLDTFEYNRQDDEIDFFELFASLMQQWRWLVGIMVLGMAISVAVALLLPKQYEVSAKVAVPDISNAMALATVNYVQETRDRERDYDQDAEKLFQQYYNMLKSRVLFNRFLQEGGWVAKVFPEGKGNRTLNFLQSKIKEDLTIDVVVPKQAKKGVALPPKVVELKIMGIDEELIAKLINDYIEYAAITLLSEIKKSGQEMAASEVSNISKNIDLLRSDAKRVREIRVLKLKEALVLAEKIRIIKPDSVRLYSQNNQQSLAGSTASSMEQSEGLFLLGSEYLNGEIENLQNRKSDDAFIEDYLSLVKRLEKLNNMTFDFSGIQPYRINKVAEVDGKAEKPKRALIVAVGSVLAFFVAIFIALIMGAVKRRRELA